MGNILGFLTNAKIKAKLFLLLGISIGGLSCSPCFHSPP